VAAIQCLLAETRYMSVDFTLQRMLLGSQGSSNVEWGLVEGTSYGVDDAGWRPRSDRRSTWQIRI